MSEPFDVVIIGGGTAGLVTASGCARLGRRVALIEREALGGDCLWTGCVPTKALVASAKLAHQMRHASDWGLEPSSPKITPKSIMDSMRESQRIAGRHDDPEEIARSRQMLSDEEIEIHTGWSVKSVRREGNVKVARIENKNGESKELRVGEVFVASGRRGNIENLGLEEIGVKVDRTFVVADKYLQTSVPRIWACGDVHGALQF